MLNYLEEVYGERATNGDVDLTEKLTAQIKDLERKLDEQKAREASKETADSAGDRDAANSEDETDQDDSDDYVDDLPD